MRYLSWSDACRLIPNCVSPRYLTFEVLVLSSLFYTEICIDTNFIWAESCYFLIFNLWFSCWSLANVDPIDVARNIVGLNPETTLGISAVLIPKHVICNTWLGKGEFPSTNYFSYFFMCCSCGGIKNFHHSWDHAECPDSKGVDLCRLGVSLLQD